MNKLSSTVLLIGISLLTVVCAVGKITPMAWLLVYAGWTWLLQHHGRQVLKEQDAARSVDPSKLPVTRLPAQPTQAAD